MDNNSTEKEPGMGAAEETEILDTIENYIAVSTIYTTVDMETTGVDADNTLVRVKIIGVGIYTPGVQEISHEDKTHRYEDDDTSNIADKYIP